ncbi:MAG: hypothetical protein PSV16_09945 [Flavobacterium sp.]|nr:hypothetical protein [Flavobacterium sp.]
MKTCIFIILTLLLSINVNAQESLMTMDNNSKSGNFKDVLTNFYQLTTKDFAGDEKSIGLNTTLFALLSNAKPELLNDINYASATFSRNFQLNTKVDFDKTYSYTGFTAGISYSINNRDATLANFNNTELAIRHALFAGYIAAAAGPIGAAIGGNAIEQQKLDEAVEDLLDSKTNSTNPYVRQLLNAINPLVNADNLLDKSGAIITTGDALVLNLYDLKDDYYNTLAAKGLLTFSADGTSNTDGKFNKATFSIIYLKGNSQGNNEIDLRTKLVYADTLTSVKIPRIGFNATAGINFKIAKGSDKKSFFEIKTAFEYNSVLRNAIPDEDKNKILANAEIRFRILNDIWIPLTIKYDLDNANFLGFLNVTYNFGD